MTTTLKVGSATHTGQVRTINEDSQLIVEPIRLYAVADGMGGHQGGDVASAMAVEILESSVTKPSPESLVEAVTEANRTIHARAAEDADLRGMGTTMCAIAVVDAEDGGDEIAWINVGDSRIYLFRDDALTQLTTDHSLVEDLRRDGQLTDDEAAVHPQRNIVTRALGIAGDVDVDCKTLIAFNGDRFLLSSDGLFNELSSDQISATLRRLADPGEAADDLVRQANEHGGRDNITVVIVEVTDDGGRLAAADAAASDDQARAAARAAAAAAAEAEAAQAAEGEGETAADSHEIGHDSDNTRNPVGNDEVEAPGDPTTDQFPIGAGADASPSADRVGFGVPAAAVGSNAGGSDGKAPADGDELPFGRSTEDIYTDLDRVKGRHVTWRVISFLLALLVILGVAFGAVGWYAKRTYFIDYVGNEVAIYQGQPGGLLIFDPKVNQRTGVLRSSLTDAEDQTVTRQQTFGSLREARTFANNLKTLVDQRQATTTTTVPTTTTAPAPKTTKPASPTTQGPPATLVPKTTVP